MSAAQRAQEALRYHDRTKHHFHRFAPALGYLDWATQPNPFRRYDGARLVALSRRVHRGAERDGGSPAALTPESLAEFLRCSLGLSAWKQYGESRWALRVNPSSGNLHPTEGYVVTGDGVFHYAPREHALEERCRASLAAAPVDWSTTLLVGLTSIHWREAWKYGERAFRYCQHDVGHAIAALRYSAALLGWGCALLPRWSDAQVSALLGLTSRGSSVDGRPEEASEPESPDCLMAVTVGDVDSLTNLDPDALLTIVSRGEWQGTANALSPSRVEWPAIEEVARETAFPGASALSQSSRRTPQGTPIGRDIILRRRSAVAFDGRSALSRAAFAAMLQRLIPGTPPWDAIWWPPHVHLVLFVHRVDGLLPGIYAFLRDTAPGDLAARDGLASACRGDFLWEPVEGIAGLFLLAPFDCRAIARRLSCDQDIAADGFFGLAMLARFEDPIRERGAWFYRHLFWECGMIGQALYLEAEAAGARATGIGCYYDEPTHELLGLSGHAWQSLYHFSAGVPVEDTRLTTEPGYDWEREG